MLSRLDEIIYPNRCEVIQLASQRFFYPIYKNGSSSVAEYARLQSFKTLIKKEILDLKNLMQIQNYTLL